MSDFHFSPRPNRAAEIRWREWGTEPFDESNASAKPVLLAISAVWCHWCHVMDETTYSNSSVIDLINERFVPVRVDNDRRPDINARYNMGGWPTTAILSPDGEVIHGGTYIPPDAMHRLLSQIEQFYAEPDNRLELAKRIHEVTSEHTRRPRAVETGPLDRNTAAVVFTCLEDRFDADYGGFGDEQKFPQTGTLHFLLDSWARTKDARAETMVVKSLRGMAGGGMYDHVEGGFFRYSTTRDFSVPHFEKMLEDLGGLLLACARSHAAFDDADDKILPDLSARVSFTSEATSGKTNRTRILVPKTSVVSVNGKPGVFRVVDEHAQFVPVQTAGEVQGQIEITSGLQGGEKIVAAPVPAKLREGDRVRVESESK